MTSFAKVAKPDVALQIQCSNCFVSVKSRWKWKHPGTGKLHILVPQTGHESCSRQLGKTKMPLAGCRDFPPINDNVAEQDFCAHGRQIMNCRICGGRHICLHGRRRYQCSICKVQSPGPQSVTAAKNNTALWLRDLASSKAENHRRCHEDNSFSSCWAPSASIGSAGSV